MGRSDPAETGVPKFAEELKLPLIRSVLLKGLEAQHAKRYKLAGTIFQNLLQLQPKQRVCLRALGSMALDVSRYAEAIFWLQKGVQVYPEDALFSARLGDAYSGLSKYQWALDQYDRSLGLVVEQNSAVASKKLANLFLSDETRSLPVEEEPSNGTALRAVSAINKSEVGDVDEPSAGDLHGPVTVEGLKIACAKVLHKIGDGRLANAILLAILKDNPGNLEALQELGNIFRSRGFIKDALQVFLKLMIAKPYDKGVRRGLSQIIQHPQGLEALKKEVASEVLAAPAVAFIASCVKDYSAINEAVELYLLALKLSPSSTGYSLSLMHLYEVTYEHPKALRIAVSVSQNFQSFSFKVLQCSDVIACIENVKCNGQDQQLLQSMSETRSESPKCSALPPQDNQEEQNVYDSEPSGQLNTTESIEGLRCYDENDLDGLAILFTITKILFVDGALERAYRLARLVEPVRAASAKPLHQTFIRNEAAYFICVHKILEANPIPLPLPLFEETSTIYLAGDSHCMSAAWRSVRLRDESYLLVPLLVTGLKVWHLRPESDFYTKFAFQKAMQNVADGSKVITLFGEIDCREGILIAVEKGVYQDVEQGVEVVVKLYLDILERLLIDRGLELFVHPVPPVLNETRPIVHTFNDTLERSLISYRQKNPTVGTRLHWLNFLSDLLTAEGLLKEEFHLDGTHLSPSYQYLLSREMERV